MKVLTLAVGMLETNCYILFDDHHRAIVVDPGEDVGRILDMLHTYSLFAQQVILTHAHYDHMAAAEAIRKATGATLAVCEKDADMLADPRRNLSAMYHSTPLSLTADRLLGEGDIVRIGEEQFLVMETPGHTPGSICLVGEEHLISGDTLFAGSVGRVDFPDGNAAQMQLSLGKIKKLPGCLKVLPGHGPATTLQKEMLSNPYLMD